MSEGECVKVVVRCRPANSREKELKSQKVVKIDRRGLSCSLVRGAEEPKTFTYDNVYDDDSFQQDVYDETAFPLVKSVMEGYNGTIFAYGQTGCGKTFTMEGIRSDPILRGIIPRTFDQIFEFINTADTSGDKKFLVAISYVEIYNEEVRDLLGDNPKARMDVKEDPEKGVFIKNLSQPEVTSVNQIEALMNQGNKCRSVGATAMNATSSRSHSLFTVRIETSEQVPGVDEPRIKAGKLNLVDLAGSERQGKTEATGDRLKEAQKINLSLSALGNVISALVVASGKTGKGEVHIPYRDSKLTRLLQDSLGGNTKTIMIAAVSPAADNYDETLSTLRYANRAKNIKNKPKVNEDPKDAMLREFQDEIKRLKAMLESQGLGGALASGGGEKKKKKKKKRMNADGVMDPSSEEEESEEEDEVPRPKRVKKKREKKANGEIEDLEEDDDDDDEIEDEVDGGGSKKSRRGGLDKFASPAERAKFAEAKADFEAELSKIQQEKEKHEKFALMLEEQMRIESASLAAQAEQTAAEKAAALIEIETRLTAEKEEHEAKARELEEEMARSKEEEAAKQVQHAAQIQSLQSEALTEKLALKAKLKKLQQKLMDGGAKHKTAAQEAEEKARLALEEAMALKQAEAREREAKLALEEEKLLLEENYSSIKDEVIGKTRKLKKIKKKLLEVQQEVEDSRSEWAQEKDGYLGQLRDALRELKLYKQVAAQVLTKSDLEKIVRGSVWQEARDEWQLPRIDLPVFFPTVRLIPGVGLNGTLPGASATSSSQQGGPPATRGGARPPAQQDKRGGGASSSSSGVKRAEEEKGADGGWKKSVTAGFDRSDYNPNANGRQVSRQAQAQAQQARQPSPPAAQHQPPSSLVPHPPAPRNLDSLGGGGRRTPRQSSPTDGDPLSANVVRRPAFEGGVVMHSNEDSHAHLLNVMDSTASRGTFAPDKTTSLHGRKPSGAGAIDMSEVPRKAAFNPSSPLPPNIGHDSPLLTHNEPAKRAAFAPGSLASQAAEAHAHDALVATLSNGPAKRAAFNPGATLSASAIMDASSDSLASSFSVPKRSAFDPKAGGGFGQPSAAAPALHQTSLPADLPAARSFNPGSFAPSPAMPSQAMDILAAHSALPMKSSFNPGGYVPTMAAAQKILATSDQAFPTSPTNKPRFTPAH